MSPRARRWLMILTVGGVASRLFVLGQERGFPLVARATLVITLASLGAWLLHLLLHEAAHWAAAVFNDFAVRAVRLGPVELDFTPHSKRRVTLRASLAGGVNSLPRGLERLSVRLRAVAAAGPGMTAVVTLGAWWVWRSRDESLATPLGIFVTMGALTLVTALLPGWLLPARPDSGTDLEQVLQPRAVLAHWVNAAAVQALLEGKSLAGVFDREAWRQLLPSESAPTEPFELGWCVASLDAGATVEARARLRSMVERFAPDAPPWLLTDTFNQLGCLAAFDGDVLLAKTCLSRVQETQSNGWYSALLEACIARAEGGDVAAALARWRAGADTHPAKAVALAGNGWILRRLNRLF